MWGPPMGIACKVYDQGAEAHPDLDDRDLQACLQARLAQQRRRLARQRRREQRLREEGAGREELSEESEQSEESGEDGRPDRGPDNDDDDEAEEEGEQGNTEDGEPLFIFAPTHAGWLIKRGSGGLRIWRRRWVGLDASRRLWYASGPLSEKAGAEGAIGVMELTQWSRVIEDVPGGDPLAFRVVPGCPDDELRAVAGGEDEEDGDAAEERQENDDSAEGAAPSSSSEGEEEEGAEAPAAGAAADGPARPRPQHGHHRRGSSGGAGGGPGNGNGSVTPPRPPLEGWLFRAESAPEKAAWVARLKECIALSRWWAGLRFGPALGEGGFSQVFEMVDMARGERLAVKVMEARSRMERDQCVAETAILASIGEEIRHPHLMAPRRVYVEGGRAWLMFPLCRGGDLFHRLHAHGRLPEPAAAVLLHRLLGAVAALHAHGILHLDIKPENVLFASPGPDAVEPHHVRLTDFGLSRRVHRRRARGALAGSGGSAASLVSEEDGAAVGDDALLEQDWDYLARLRYNLEFDARLNGTIGYMSPEVVLHKRYSPAADVWSLGVVLHILLLGRSPWQPPRPATPEASDGPVGWDGDADLGDGSGSGSGSNGSSLDARRAILARSVKGQYSTEGPEWARVSDGARDLVRRMLCVDDAARISTGEALAHPWLAEAASAAAAASGRTAVAGGPGRQQQRPPVVGGRGRGGGEAEAEWVHTPSGEAPGAIRSLIGAVWCRGSSFVARFSSPRGAGAKVSHSASGTETTSSISSAVTS